MTIILDANVLIAAVAGRGLCESLLELCLEEHDIVVSEELLEEVRSKLVRKIKVPDAFAEAFCGMLRQNGRMETSKTVPMDACRDPKDLYVLGLARAAQAEFIVTGDKDPLAGSRYGATLIVTPRQFWDTCRRK